MENLHFSGAWIAQYPKMLLAIVLFSGLLLRLYGINFGLPDLYNVDELVLVDRAVRVLANSDPNPHWFDWPGTTIIYMLSVLFVCIFLVSLGLGFFESTNAFRKLFYQDPTVFYLSGRVMLAVFGVASIFVTYLIARRLFNRPIALVAATFLALSPLHVFHSKLIRPDILLTFLILVAFWFCLDILQRRAWSGYILAGLFTGFAIATKYPAAIMALAIVVAHLLSGPWQWANLLKLLVSGVVSLLGTFLGSPFLFLDFGTALSRAVYQNRPRHLGATGEGFVQNLAWYIQEPLVEALSIGGLVLVGMGVVLSIASRQREKWLLVAFPVFFMPFIASLNLRWERWVIPVIPFLCILAASACYWTATKLGDQWDHRIDRWVSCILLLLIAMPLLKADILQGHGLSGMDTRALAKEWMLAHIPAGSGVLLEHYTPPLSKERYRFLQVTANGWLIEVDGKKVHTAVFRPRGVIGKLKDIEAIHRKQVEYMVLSNWYDRYLAEEESYADYAEIVATYDALMDMGTKIYEIKSIPGENIGPTIRVYRFDRKGGN